MSGASSSRNKAVLTGVLGAVGAGALIAGAGVLVYNYFEKQKKIKSRHHQQLDRRNSISSTITEAETEYFSELNSDEEDYLDCFSDYERVCEADPQETLFTQIDSLMEGDDKDRSEAFNKLEENKEKLSNNVDFLWRFAKAHHMKAAKFGTEGNLEKKKEFIVEGLKYAEKALSLDDSKAVVHKWLAILIGMETEFLSVRQKILRGVTFQNHLQRAIDINPSDYSLHYLTGRFKFEIANMTWMEKKIVRQFSQDFPNVTYDDAIEDLLKAEKLSLKPRKETRLLLAKCNIKINNYSEATRWLKLTGAIPAITAEDFAIDKEICKLRQQCK